VEHVSGALQFNQHGPESIRDKGLHQESDGCYFERSGTRWILCPSISSVVFEYVSFRMILPSLKCITSTPRRFSGLPAHPFSIEGHSRHQR
jgi:hypothetical protein